MSRLKNMLSTTKTLIVRNLPTKRAITLFPTVETLRMPIGDKTHFWQFICEAARSQVHWSEIAGFYQEKLEHLTIEDFRTAPNLGINQGKTVFWNLAYATIYGRTVPLHVMTNLLDKFKDEINLQDLQAQDQNGITLLRLLLKIVHDYGLQQKEAHAGYLSALGNVSRQIVRTMNPQQTHAFLLSQPPRVVEFFLKYAAKELAAQMDMLEPNQLIELFIMLGKKKRDGVVLNRELFLNETIRNTLLIKINMTFNPQHLQSLFCHETMMGQLDLLMHRIHQADDKADYAETVDKLLVRILDEFSKDDLSNIFLSDTFRSFREYLHACGNYDFIENNLLNKLNDKHQVWLLLDYVCYVSLENHVKKLLSKIQFEELFYCPKHEKNKEDHLFWRMLKNAEAGISVNIEILNDILNRFGDQIITYLAEKDEKKALLWVLSNHLQTNFSRHPINFLSLIRFLTNACTGIHAQDLNYCYDPKNPNNVLSNLLRFANEHPMESKSIIGRLLCHFPLALSPVDLLRNNAVLFSLPAFNGLNFMLQKRINVFNAVNSLVTKTKNSKNTGRDMYKLKQAVHALQRAINNSPSNEGISAYDQVAAHLAAEEYTEYAAAIYELEPRSSIHHIRCMQMACEMHFAVAVSEDNQQLRQYWLSKSLANAKALPIELALPFIRRTADAYLTQGKLMGLNFSKLTDGILVSLYNQPNENSCFSLLDKEGKDFYKEPLTFRRRTTVAELNSMHPQEPVNKKQKQIKTIM